MIVNDRLSFAALDDLAQTAEKYPMNPPLTPGKPYRVAAIVVDNADRSRFPAGNSLPGVTVRVYKDKTLLASIPTDVDGKMYFDLATNDPVSLYPQVAKSDPTYKVTTPVAIPTSSTWAWQKAELFTVADPTPKRDAPEGTSAFEDIFTLENALIVGVVAVSGYFVIKWWNSREKGV